MKRGEKQGPFPAVPATAVDALAKYIATEAPTLADLTQDQLEAIAQVVIKQRLVKELDDKALFATVDYPTERNLFLTHVRQRSPLGVAERAYRSALAALETFASPRHLSLVVLTPALADEFIILETSNGRSPASVRRDVAACSSFFTFLERRHTMVRNPFRGTKSRPGKRATRPASYPSPEEADLIRDALPTHLRAALSMLVFRGLRIGALPSLTLKCGRFTAMSKGREIQGAVPERVLSDLKTAHLAGPRPFTSYSGTQLADGIRKKTKILQKAGLIGDAYSAHDFRHLYAVTEYRKDRDLYRISKLLGHSTLHVTETYLRGLGEVD